MNKTKAKNHQPAYTESDESNSTPNLDLSLIRKPIATSVTGFEEVLRAYEDGTNELRKLLSKECDLIYECKVCRNIFRSLTNFISHKRVYCRSSFNTSDHFHFRNNGFMVQDISTIIQEEQKINNNPNGVAGVLPGTDDKSKDLSGVVEHLLWKQHQSRSSNLNDFYDEIHTSSKRQTSEQNTKVHSQKNHTLMLNRVNDDSDIAVYQSLQTENDNSNMKDEINEVHNMLSKSNTVLGPDGSVINFHADSRDNDSPVLSTPLTCKVCQLQFETQKTLLLHLEMKHLPSSYVYQCPSCPQKFSSSAAVIRHLSNDHKKSNRRIRLMRDSIIKKRVRADEVVAKTSSSSRELQKLQQTTNGTEKTEWNEHDLNGGEQDDSYVCPSCLKKFDRKAVYTSHVQVCSDTKDREQEKLKKRKAKDGAKVKNSSSALLESEENSNISEQNPVVPMSSTSANESNVNKRKRNRTSKVKNEIEVVPKVTKYLPLQEDSEDIVDWNLDDEEEKKKLDNIKKEIIEDEYKRQHQDVQPSSSAMTFSSSNSSMSIKTENNNVSEDAQQNHDEQEQQQDLNDDDDSGLIIDEKADDEMNQFKCPQCEKKFETDDKLKYHLTYYHSRQKRFKCKMCVYQGYRKKDTMNHINFVHNADVTLETLDNYIETVSKAVDEEDIAMQNELKRNQLKIKRRMARLRKKEAKQEGEPKVDDESSPEKSEEPKTQNIPSIPEQEEPKSPQKSRRKSLHMSRMDLSAEFESENQPPKEIQINSPLKEIKIDEPLEMFDTEKSPKRRDSRVCKSPSILNISRYGKVVKSVPADYSSRDLSDHSHQRPIRNRIKPVRKDFLYDLSDLLKKEFNAHREQTIQSTNLTVKRELRKRAMSTHTREAPNLSTFDQPILRKTEPLGPPPPIPSIEINSPTKLTKDQRNRRMSVFVSPSRPMFSTVPRVPPPHKVVETPTHKNAGSAYRMALKEFENNRASLYEPKYLWSVCFDEEKEQKPLFTPPTISMSTSLSSSVPTTNISAASSILERLCGKAKKPAENLLLKSNVTAGAKPTSITAELCKKFELINVTSINDGEFDISLSESQAINLNPGGNNLLSLGLADSINNDDVSGDSTDDDSEPRLEIESERKSSRKKSRRSSKKSSEKRKVSANGQRRLTVMQRLQENKIRKSREQLFQRLMNQQNDNDDNSSQSSDFESLP